MKEKFDVSTLDTFFDGDCWDSICTQAINEGNKNAAELMGMLSTLIDSFYFFLEIKNDQRAKRELNELNKLIEYITETI
jgi:hypothetical protein